MNKITDIFYDIKNGIKNLITWFPIIWKDRNWDYEFFFDLLKFKLQLMEKNHRNCKVFCESDIKNADQIKKCIEITDRLILDEYTEKSLVEHNKKWGELEVSDGESEDGGLTIPIITHRERVITEQNKLNEREEFIKCTEEADLKQQKDIDLLFGIIKDNILRWWN